MSGEKRTYLVEGDLSFPHLYRALAKRWYWLPLAVMLGGLVGLALSLTLSPVYRATASLGIAVDYGRTHPLNPAAERAALLQAQELVLADGTLFGVIDEIPDGTLNRLGISHPADLRPHLRVDRFENRWDLSVSLGRPADAAEVANRWAAVAVDRLEHAVEHAIRARELQSRIYELGCGLEIAESTGEAVWRCEEGDPGETEDLSEQLVQAVQASHGVLPGLSFAQLRQATPPGDPIYRGRTSLLLGGAMLGLAAGLLLMILWPVSRP